MAAGKGGGGADALREISDVTVYSCSTETRILLLRVQKV